MNGFSQFLKNKRSGGLVHQGKEKSKNKNLTLHLSLQPPPFCLKFQPTVEELIDCYLRPKVEGRELFYDIFPEIDLNNNKPWDSPDYSLSFSSN